METLLLLSTSAVTRMVSPGAYPDWLRTRVADSGPWRQRRQQKFLESCTTNFSWRKKVFALNPEGKGLEVLH